MTRRCPSCGCRAYTLAELRVVCRAYPRWLRVWARVLAGAGVAYCPAEDRKVRLTGGKGA